MTKESDKKKYQKNIAKIKIRNRLWAMRNPGRVKENQRRWRANNIEKIKQANKQWRIENPNKTKNSAWKKKGIKNNDGSYFTTDNYNELYRIQQGKCDICGKGEDVMNKVFDVDHDHTTGIVRGLLCNRCNTSLGYFEQTEFYKKAKKYLIKFNKKNMK